MNAKANKNAGNSLVPFLDLFYSILWTYFTEHTLNASHAFNTLRRNNFSWFAFAKIPKMSRAFRSTAFFILKSSLAKWTYIVRNFLWGIEFFLAFRIPTNVRTVYFLQSNLTDLTVQLLEFIINALIPCLVWKMNKGKP